MATLVQQPELQQVQVSNLQATQRPVETSTSLSDFTVGLLNKGNKFIDDYDKENKDRLIALGASDYMNEYTREVSFLERKNYQQGRDFSGVVSAQTQRRQQFSKELQRMVQDPTVTEEQIFEANKEFLQSTVNDIYASDLDSDLKEKLYEETLKENLQYQKMIGSGLQAAALDRFTGTSRLVAAKTVTDLATQERTPEEQVQYVQTQFDTIKQGALSSGYAKTEEEANTAATNTIKGAFDFWFKSIDPKAPDAANSLNQLRDIGESLYAAGQYELAGDITQKVNDVQGKVLSFNDDMLVRDLTLDLHNYSVSAVDYAPEDISAKFNALAQTGLYSDATLNTWYSKYLAEFERKQEKLLAGEDDIDPQSYDTYQAYEINGGSRDKWLKAALVQAGQDAASKGLNTYTAVANELMIKQLTASTYMPELLDKAAELATTELAQWVAQTPQQLRESGGYEAYKASWDGLVQAYGNLVNGGNELGAQRFLDAIDSQYFPNKEVLRGLLETGADLTGAQKALNDPIGVARQLELVKQATSKLDVESAKLDRFWTTGNNGTWFNRVSDAVRDNTLEAMRTRATRHAGLLASKMNSGKPSNLMAGMESAGLMIRTKGTPVFVDPSVGTRINSGQLRDANGKVIAKDYFARAIDAQRYTLAKNQGGKIDPNNVLVQQSGDALYFAILDDDGNLVNTTGSFGLQGTEIPLSQLTRAAATIRDQDVKAVRSKIEHVAKPKQSQFGALGFSGAGMTAHTGRSSFTVKKDAVIHKGTVRIHGNNKRVPVNIPAAAAKPFGYNKDLTVSLLDHWNRYEGFTDVGTTAKAIPGTTSRTSKVIGWGITRRNYPEVFNRMQNARTTQERVNINTEFLGNYFSEHKLQSSIERAGLPTPSTAPVPKYLKDAYVMLADGTWHGGQGGGTAVAKALSKGTYAEAEREFKASTLFKAIPANHPRNQWNLNTLRQFYNSKALQGGQSLNIGGRNVKPVGNTFVPYRIK